MKVLLVNGSARQNGCTAAALREVEKSLNENGVETQTIFIGTAPISDCLACRKCAQLKKCVINDCVNEFAEMAKQADGFVFGSPVYYAHPSGRLLSFMDRVFFSAGKSLAFKPAAAVLSARRAGTVASLDVINKYFTINSMPVVASTYWNQVYAREASEVELDAEGLTTMHNIGKNMAWLIKAISMAKNAGLEHPQNEKVFTNFIR